MNLVPRTWDRANSKRERQDEVLLHVNVRFEFPFKLHRILEDAAANDQENIIAWLPSSNAFKVHNKKAFETIILPKYFSNAPKYRSFTRQLAIYGFTMCNRTTNNNPNDQHTRGSYTHPLLCRGHPELCHGMVRQRIKYCSSIGPTAIDKEPIHHNKEGHVLIEAHCSQSAPYHDYTEWSRSARPFLGGGLLLVPSLHPIAIQELATTDDLNVFAHLANNYLDALDDTTMTRDEAVGAPLVEAARVVLYHAMNIDKVPILAATPIVFKSYHSSRSDVVVSSPSYDGRSVYNTAVNDGRGDQLVHCCPGPPKDPSLNERKTHSGL